jgi:phage gp45-like
MGSYNMTGIIRGYEIKKNRDSSQNVLMLQCEISGTGDNQSVEYMSHAGDDHIPPIGSIVTILSAGKSWKIAIASNDKINFNSNLSEGEKEIYSSAAGIKEAIITLLNTGNIEINGNSDFAVAFNDLKAGFDQLKSDFNTHVHASNGVPPTILSTASIDGSKVSNVLLP